MHVHAYILTYLFGHLIQSCPSDLCSFYSVFLVRTLLPSILTLTFAIFIYDQLKQKKKKKKKVPCEGYMLSTSNHSHCRLQHHSRLQSGIWPGTCFTSFFIQVCRCRSETCRLDKETGITFEDREISPLSMSMSWCTIYIYGPMAFYHNDIYKKQGVGHLFGAFPNFPILGFVMSMMAVAHKCHMQNRVRLRPG